MKTPHPAFTIVAASAALVLGSAFPSPARAETDILADAQALLQEARDGELTRRTLAKQKDLERLEEDAKRVKVEIFESEQRIQKVDAAIAESAKQIQQLAADKNRFTQELDVVNLRIDAEKLKADALKLLTAAHGKLRDALNRQSLEIELRTSLAAAEKERLAELPPVASGPSSSKSGSSKSKSGTTSAISDLRKRLSTAEQATSTANTAAREAMEAASEKLKAAETAAAKLEKKRAEITLERNPSFPGGNDPLENKAR